MSRASLALVLLALILSLKPSISLADCTLDICFSNARPHEVCAGLKPRDRILVDFWASWCPNCHKTLAHLESLRARIEKRGIKVITVNLDQARSDADDYLKRFPHTLPIIFDTQGRIAESCKLDSLPATILFSAERKEIQRWYGSSQKTAQAMDQWLTAEEQS